MSGSKKSAKVQQDKYGKDFHARIGAKGGSAKVKKGFAVILERMTPTERADFYRRRNEKRHNREANSD